MAERKLFAQYEQGKLLLILQSEGSVPIDEIKQELLSISLNYSLPPEGGLFDVAEKAVNGDTSYRLGGLYIQLDKEEVVTKELLKIGYIIEQTKA